MELGEVLLLPVVELLLIHQTYVVFLQLAEHLLRGSGVLPTVLLVELVHGLDGLLQDLAGCIAHMLALGQPGERSHADTGKLVEVVGIDAQEREPFQRGQILFAGFLQYAVVEIHPTHVAVNILPFFLFFIIHNMCDFDAAKLRSYRIIKGKTGIKRILK